MKAQRRDQKRREAEAREATGLLSRAERDRIRAQAWAIVKNVPRTPRRVKIENAQAIYASLCADLERQKRAQAQLVKPETTGLIAPRSSLLITPDEARAIDRRFGR